MQTIFTSGYISLQCWLPRAAALYESRFQTHQSEVRPTYRSALVLNFGHRAPSRGSPKVSHLVQVLDTSSREGTALLAEGGTRAGLGGCDLEKCQLNYYRVKGAT